MEKVSSIQAMLCNQYAILSFSTAEETDMKSQNNCFGQFEGPAKLPCWGFDSRLARKSWDCQLMDQQNLMDPLKVPIHVIL